VWVILFAILIISFQTLPQGHSLALPDTSPGRGYEVALPEVVGFGPKTAFSDSKYAICLGGHHVDV
jgi:hypothetical protein